ncbi:GNAT family N-acetyltransferase [Flavobacterium sp. NKUCC04_CG]|uniref:GNAT family N-acetyltransferase n=1 Tax=Flavobacterium sp. NKUCC04_CG TaxID=2842121 RepID=UPI001C5B2665|nr:GNAT family N-acetyltransferase [Flavobacterium sp. NKUCC04_CG]MBW3520459.1 GNAT family N-acetyltransferase [Flavobacterium sp. NKUCC04_CG]
MITLKGDLVYLRALEPDDLEFVYQLENEEALWEVSNTQTPYSRFLIHQYLENAHLDIYETKQLRLVICLQASKEAVGLIDLFDFDPKNQRAGIGIVINKQENRLQGIGSEALELLINYAFHHLHLHQLYANISTDNMSSERLFIKFGFQCIGVKKDWIRVGTDRKDEALYQLLNTKK